MIVLLCSGFLAYGAETRASDTLVAATQANEVRHEVDALVADILQAESSMRGYLLTAHLNFLASANAASSASNSDLIQLERLTASDAGQAPAMGRLQQLITDRLTVLDELRPFAPVTDSTHRGPVVSLMGEGAGLMNTIQSVLAEMDATEGRRYASEQAALRTARHRAFLVAVIVTPGASLLALAMVLLFAERSVGRIRGIKENARRLRAGEPLVDANAGHDEISELGRALVETGATLHELQEELRSLATSDELTGLANRRGFLAVAEFHLRLAARMGHRLTLTFVDLDGLKRVNDTFGHAKGDEMLREAANVLLDVFRSSDLTSRLGGDEFCVLLAADEDPGAQIAISRLREVVARRNLEPGRTYQLSFSVGVAEFDPGHPMDIDQLLSLADDRMYVEKRAKREASLLRSKP
jgi:diguanylate cyclase (GGDEF)-like protein